MELLDDLLDQAEAYARELPPAAPLPTPPAGAEIAAWIDHTLLQPEASVREVKQLCDEAREYGFAAVCVNPAYAQLAAGLLHETSVPVCCVVAFPFGATTPTLKVVETLACLNAGASEIDMVHNIGALKSAAYGQVFNEIQSVTQAVHNQRAAVKVILETALLTREEIILACLISRAAGADYVKTSTGFGPGGATPEDVSLMRRVVGAEMGVKASGGIHTYAAAQAMISAGASQLGTSHGVEILAQARAYA